MFRAAHSLQRILAIPAIPAIPALADPQTLPHGPFLMPHGKRTTWTIRHPEIHMSRLVGSLVAL